MDGPTFDFENMANLDIMALFEWGGLGDQKEADLGKSNIHSAEEIEKFTVDEGLSEYDRAQQLLRKGQPSQRLSVLTCLRSLFDPDNCAGTLKPMISLIMPIVCSDSHVCEERVAAVTSVRRLLDVNAGVVPESALTGVVMPLVTRSLKRSKERDLLQAVCDLALDLLPRLPDSYVTDTLLSLAQQLGSVSECAARRTVCCRLLGAIAGLDVMSGEQVEKSFFEQAMGLCQDTDACVREAMASQLGNFARKVSAAAVEDTLVGELAELLKDEDSSVKVAALQAVVATRPCVPNACFQETLLPPLHTMLATAKRKCASTSRRGAGGSGAGSGGTGGSGAGSGAGAGAAPLSKLDKAAAAQLLFGIGPVNASMLPSLLQGTSRDDAYVLDPVTSELAQGFGGLLVALVEAGDVVPSTRATLAPFADFYGALAQHSYPSARQLCAYNLPAVTQALGRDAYEAHVHHTVTTLSKDDDESVRKSVAAGLHQVAKVVGPDMTVALLRSVFLELLADSSSGVVGKLARSMDDWLLRFYQPDAEEAKQNTVYSSIVPAMVAAAKSKSVTGFWRRQVRVLAAWRLLPFLCPKRSTSEDVMAVLQTYLDIGSAPVRRATVCTMVWFMRFGATGVIRAKMKHSLLTTDVLCGSSWWRRHLFPDACGATMWLFSRAFFKAHFLKCLLACTEDAVACVRRKAVESLPLLRLWVRFPKDAEVISKLIAAATAATEDNNDGVRTAANRVLEDLEKMEGVFATAATGESVTSAAKVHEYTHTTLQHAGKSFDTWMCSSSFLCCPFNPPAAFAGVGINGDGEVPPWCRSSEAPGAAWRADSCLGDAPGAGAGKGGRRDSNGGAGAGSSAAAGAGGAGAGAGAASSGAGGAGGSGPLSSVALYTPRRVFPAVGAHSEGEEKERQAAEEALVAAAAAEEAEESRRTLEARRQEARERAAAKSETLSAAQRARNWEQKRIRMGLDPRGGPPARGKSGTTGGSSGSMGGSGRSRSKGTSWSGAGRPPTNDRGRKSKRDTGAGSSSSSKTGSAARRASPGSHRRSTAGSASTGSKSKVSSRGTRRFS